MPPTMGHNAMTTPGVSDYLCCVSVRRQHRKGQWGIGARNRPLRAGRKPARATHRSGGVSNYSSLRTIR